MPLCRVLSLLVVLLWSLLWPWTPCALLSAPLLVGPWVAVLLSGLLSWAMPPLPSDLSRDHVIARRIGAAAVSLTLACCAGCLVGWAAGEPVTLEGWQTCLHNAAGSWLAARALVCLEGMDR